MTPRSHPPHYSGVQPGSGAAEPRKTAVATHGRREPTPIHTAPADRGPYAAYALLEILTVIGGLVVVGSIALFFLALA
jgi:hypothetical protein